jgi:hypothetical protein
MLKIWFICLTDFATWAKEMHLFKKLLHSTMHLYGNSSCVAVQIRTLPVTSFFYTVFTEEFVARGALLWKGTDNIFAKQANKLIYEIVHGCV